jgi:hypothetical protein
VGAYRKTSMKNNRHFEAVRQMEGQASRRGALPLPQTFSACALLTLDLRLSIYEAALRISNMFG